MHLIITIQNSGTQELFDHTVYDKPYFIHVDFLVLLPEFKRGMRFVVLQNVSVSQNKYFGA